MKIRRLVRAVGTLAVAVGLLAPALVRADDAAPAQPAAESSAAGAEVKAPPTEAPSQAAPDTQAAPDKAAKPDEAASPKQ